MNAIDEVRQTVAEVNDLLCSLNLLTWDARTQMPAKGAPTRGKALATLSKVARERLLSPHLAKALNTAEAAEHDEDTRAELAQVREAIEVLGRLPEGLLESLAETRSHAQDVWERAKLESDFAAFAPSLERMVDLNRELAHAIGFEDHLYDALVGLYEPGMTAARLQNLFGELRGGLLPLLEAIRDRDKPDTSFLHRDFPPEAQREAALYFAQLVGFDTSRGRLDTSAHPFEISFTRNDVRITTRYRRDFLPMSLFGTLHETGHAVYEQGVAEAYVRTAFTTDFLGLYAVAGASYGVHESQSRLLENLIGRSLEFWQAHFITLQNYFPEQLGDVDTEAFYRAVNRVQPSLTRVEADEVTYNLHIMLRVDLETALLEGTLAVKDLPEAWNAAVKSLLALDVPDDAHGCLQDIHWAAGLFGSFPTYTLGNVMSAQWLDAAKAQDAAVAPALAQGNPAPLLSWLGESVHRHGRRYSPDDLLRHATGQQLTTQPYLNYLRDKYGELYHLVELH